MPERPRITHRQNENIYAQVMADSLAPSGQRLTTMQVQCHRFVLSEFNTHRAFSRNSASSRAIPVTKQLDRVLANPAIPLVFPHEQKGMQGGTALDELDSLHAREAWLGAMTAAVQAARELAALGVHKSVVNRLIEPFMWHTIIVSSTEWGNFFSQRCSPLAQPEIHAVADCMRSALSTSVPDKLREREWHLPYIGEEDRALEDDVQALARVSAARCARVSYLTQEGIRDMEEDTRLFLRLTEADPPHWSPLEHVAMPSPWEHHPAEGNFSGWAQLRGLVELGVAA